MQKQFMRILSVLTAVMLFGAAEAYAQIAQIATVVTQSGEQFRGQIVSIGNTTTFGRYDTYDGNGGSVVIRSNGRERQIPIADVAFVDFVGNGFMPRGEMARANQMPGGMIVLRNGRTISARDLRTVPMSQIMRIYFGDVYAAENNGYYGNRQYDQYPSGQYEPFGQNDQYGQSAFSRTVTIPSNRQWSSSGIDVRRGDIVHFHASGDVTLSQNGGDFATPAGATSGRTAGNSPLPGVTGGMLIGRVGNGQPFAIGVEADVTMPASGRLWLGINDDYVDDNTGSFVVDINR